MSSPNKYRSAIWITTQFEGFHAWTGCPFEDVDFLRDRHRHIFHVKLTVPVTHSDRDVEFIRFKREVNEFLKQKWPDGELGCMSCEMIGSVLLDHFTNASVCEVSEDGENGAIVGRI
jgi:hypothetical protein